MRDLSEELRSDVPHWTFRHYTDQINCKTTVIYLFYLCISIEFLQNCERTENLLLLPSLVSIFKPEESVAVVLSRSRSIPFIIPPTLHGRDWINLTNEEQVQEDSDPYMIPQSVPRSSFHSLGMPLQNRDSFYGYCLKG